MNTPKTVKEMRDELDFVIRDFIRKGRTEHVEFKKYIKQIKKLGIEKYDKYYLLK